MARIARVVVPGYFHHIIQWGNRSQNVFFSGRDKDYYLKLLDRHAREAGVKIYGYCLMDNHVHLVAIPARKNSFSLGIGKVHRDYTNMVNRRESWKGHLWQGRFMSYPLDRKYLYEVIHFVERTPVRRGIAKKAEEYPWSSVHMRRGHKNKHTLTCFVRLGKHNGQARKARECCQYTNALFKQHSSTGRPLGDRDFIKKVEELTGRDLTKKKTGPKQV